MTYTLNQLLHTSSCLMYVVTLYIAFTLHIPTLNIRFTKFDPGQLKYLTIWDVVSYIFLLLPNLHFLKPFILLYILKYFITHTTLLFNIIFNKYR